MARLIPKSRKAEAILRDRLKGDNFVRIHENKRNRLLLVSGSGTFSLWVDLKSSPDWEVIL
jgi:hypothetical protein